MHDRNAPSYFLSTPGAGLNKPERKAERIMYKRDIVEWSSPIETSWLQKTVRQGEMGTNEARILTTTNGAGSRRLGRGARRLLARLVRDAPFSRGGAWQCLNANARMQTQTGGGGVSRLAGISQIVAFHWCPVKDTRAGRAVRAHPLSTPVGGCTPCYLGVDTKLSISGHYHASRNKVVGVLNDDLDKAPIVISTFILFHISKIKKQSVIFWMSF